MTSQLNVDTIVDKAGSGGSNVKMANTSTYVAEGGGATQNTVQGVVKAWVGGMNHTSQDFEDSFNASSYTDPGVGRGQITLTNNMNNPHYSVTHGSMSNYPYQAISDSTSQYTLSIVSSSASFADGQCNGMVVGDLA